MWVIPAACEQDFYVGGTTPSVVTENGTTTGCRDSCTNLLTSGFADLDVHYPELPPDFYYYAHQQHDITPLCVVQPRSVEAVAFVVKSIREHECPFAVKSGGHNTATGTSTRRNGMVVDLKYLNQIKLSRDKKTALVGPGSRWGNVYEELEPHNLTIVGGRVSSVGVGGFTLGGGISFLSRRYGWALDNVRSFQIVLPNGTITQTSEDSHPELYFALRAGGSSNFGIVTCFNFKTHKQDLVWGGINVYLMEDLPQRRAALGLQYRSQWTFHSAAITATRWLQKVGVSLGYGIRSRDLISAFVKLANDEQDASPHAYLLLAWVPYLKCYVIGGTAVYSNAVERPNILRNLTQPSGIMSSNRFARISDFSKEIDSSNPVGERQHWRSLTFKVDGELISKLWDILLEEFEPFILAIPDALMSTNLQLLTKGQLALSSKNSGETFGISPNDGPLFLFSITISYKSAKDDATIQKLSDTIMSRAVELAKQMGLYHPFIYPNYAAAGQDVFSGFSPEQRQRLKDTHKVYDPHGAFASLQPNHFNLRNDMP